MNCNRLGCPNEAWWHPVLILYAPRSFGDAPPARAEVSMCVCDECKDKLTVDDLVTDQNWPGIVLMFRQNGFVSPDRSRTQLEFTACQ